MNYTIKRKILRGICIAVLLCVFASSFLNLTITSVKGQQQTQTTLLFSTPSDGFIRLFHANYSVARNSSSAPIFDSEYYLRLGQRLTGGNYFVYRVFLFFNTSVLPSYANIQAVNLSIHLGGDFSTTDFNVTIQNGQPSYPHDPLQTGDYALGNYSGNGGQRSTADMVDEGGYYNITFSNVGLTWINLTGTTKLCLRSDRDINNITPTGYEHIEPEANEYDGTWRDPKIFIHWYPRTYTLNGVYDEDTGLLMPQGERAVNVTVYYANGTGTITESFELNGTYTYNCSNLPLYFHFNLTNPRQYWISEDEHTSTIYVFDHEDTDIYHIEFLDLVGILHDYPFVSAKRSINGTYMIVEKRRVDEEDKVIMSLKFHQKYSFTIGNAIEITYGDVECGLIGTIQLTIKGIDFPRSVTMTYRYLRIYGLRAFGTPDGSILINYEDTLEETSSVFLSFQYQNRTEAHNYTTASDLFSYNWTNAQNSSAYRVEVTYTHGTFGTRTWKQYFPIESESNPFSLDFLGSLPFDTSLILPSILIIFVAVSFSVINAYLGAFLTVIVAIILTIFGMIQIEGSALITGFALAIMMGIIVMKRKVRTA